MTPLILSSLALGLAGPAPALLARARWGHRVPRAMIVLWQSLAAAAVLAALGAGLSVGLGFVVEGSRGPWQIAAHAVVLVLTATVAARLAWAAARVAVTTRRRRFRHRTMVDLVAAPHERARDLRVLSDTRPIAYCLPGTLTRRVVLSEGTLASLEPDELDAVLRHERAHLRARHDLVLEAFTALHTAFPRLVRSAAALHAVRTLIEMLADDAARRRAGNLPLARALVTLAQSPVPAEGLAAGSEVTLQRIHRLRPPRRGDTLVAAGVYVVAASLIVVPTLAVALPWLDGVWRALAG